MICVLFDEKTGQDDESGIGFDLKDSMIMYVFWQNDVDFECSSNPFHILWFVHSSHRPGFFKSCTNTVWHHIFTYARVYLVGVGPVAQSLPNSCWNACWMSVIELFLIKNTLLQMCAALPTSLPNITSPVLLI